MTNELKSRPKKDAGQRFDIVERTELLAELRELMQNDDLTITYIAKHFNINYSTASQWRKAALKLIARDDQGFTRDAIRHIQVGRINGMLSRLQVDLNTVTDPIERGKIHDRIIKYYENLARITGLNSETIDHTISAKPLNIVMPSTEGEIVQPSIDVPPRTP
jgi:hypothetical protein